MVDCTGDGGFFFFFFFFVSFFLSFFLSWFFLSFFLSFFLPFFPSFFLLCVCGEGEGVGGVHSYDDEWFILFTRAHLALRL